MRVEFRINVAARISNVSPGTPMIRFT